MVKSIWNNSQILVPRSFINITTKLEAPPPKPVQFLKFQPKDGKVWQSFFAVSKGRWRHSPRNPQNPTKNWRFIKLRGLPVPTEPKDNQKTNIVNKQNKLGMVEQADWTIFFGKNDHMKASSSLVNKTYKSSNVASTLTLCMAWGEMSLPRHQQPVTQYHSHPSQNPCIDMHSDPRQIVKVSVSGRSSTLAKRRPFGFNGDGESLEPWTTWRTKKV